MASTSRPNHPQNFKYDVFLSFRGDDTRHTFTDHLYQALRRGGLSTFRDDDGIPRGQVLKPGLETAIIQSKASIVVLSKNYVTSRWCLDELCLILDQRSECGHFVLPVFYHVEASDVRNQRGKFAIEESKWLVDDVTRWKAALREVANLTGMVVHSGQTYETESIKKLVETVNCQLDLNQVISIPDHLIGMKTRIEDINSLLKNEQYNAISIYGMGGLGKTTLAQCIYNSNKHHFKSSSFVENVGENYKHGLLRIQKQLLRDVSGNEKIKISNSLEGTSKIEEVLRTKKVLIVLDDIDDLEELSILLGTKAFHTESRIIITTRLQNIDKWFVSKSSRCKMHNLHSLSGDESLELFSRHAFQSKTLMEGFEVVAKQLVKYCGGNPLALRVFGSSLFVRDEDLHNKKDMIETWRERVDSLGSPNGDLIHRINDVLQKSYGSLSKSEKELFLDIDCFFVGKSKKLVTSLYSKSWIATLINRCLVTVSPDTNKLMMHQLLQDMGRNIVYDESKYPEKCSRVWNYCESYDLISKGVGSHTIEGLELDMRTLNPDIGWNWGRSRPIEASSIGKMDKLKLLKIKYVNLTGSFENFPKLRLLSWEHYPLNTISPMLFKNSMVVIDMSEGYLETFEAPTVLNSLKILNLAKCLGLVSVFSLYNLPKLESLNLFFCTSLTHLCESIKDLKMLQTLNLNHCRGLESLPSIPSTLEELYVDFYPLERITFQSGRFNLQVFSKRSCIKLREVQGLYKLVPVAKIDEADLVQPMQWVKAFEYQFHRPYMIGDKNIEWEFVHNMMLYEFGIMSTYLNLRFIKDQSKMTSEYTSSSSGLSFFVPSHHENNSIQGLHVTCLYRMLRFKDSEWGLLVKISNETKGLTWVYNPLVHHKPSDNQDALWLSYWPIVNTLDDGDEVHVEFFVDKGLEVIECGASLVYKDDDKVKKEKICENNMSNLEVIGVDLSEFMVTTGGYYLCRQDIFGSETSSWLKRWFGNNVDYPDSEGWKKALLRRVGLWEGI